MATRLIVVLATLWVSATILAQPIPDEQRQAVTAPPPAIEFPGWKEVETGEFTRVFEEAFPSAYVSGYPENDTVRVRAFLPTEVRGPVPCVVVLHYWGATDLTLEEDLAREMNAQGLAAVVMTLPYHLSRTPKGTRSGELALQPHPAKLIATMTQSVLDLRRTVDWVQSRPEFDKDKVGLAGTSLGGIVAALGYGIERRFRSGVFVLAGADIASLLWESSRVVDQREALRRQGFTVTRLREALRPIEPLAYLDPKDSRAELVIAASYDTVVPPQNARALIQALGNPQTVWLPTGHYGGALARGRIVRTVAGFFASSMKGQPFSPDASIPALSLWFGLVATPEKGLQVALATDVWRAGRGGQTFASVMATPQGLQGFLGEKLGQSFAAGAVVFPNRTTIGAFYRVAF